MQSTLYSYEMQGFKRDGYHFVVRRRSFNTTSHIEVERRAASMSTKATLKF